MQILSQRDWRWSSVKLGKSVCTIGRYGCVTTDISMLLDYFKMYKNPGELAKTLTYTKDGLLVWESLKKVGLKLDKRGYQRNDADIRQALNDPKTGVILQVQGNHWVLATGRSLFGGYAIADPFYGDRATTRRYSDKITGYAILSKV